MIRCSVRPVDQLGRVVLPKEIRKQLGIEDGITNVAISLHGDKLVLEKYESNKTNLLEQVTGLLEKEIEHQQYKEPYTASVLIHLLSQIKG